MEELVSDQLLKEQGLTCTGEKIYGRLCSKSASLADVMGNSSFSRKVTSSYNHTRCVCSGFFVIGQQQRGSWYF